MGARHVELAEAGITREILGAFFDSYNTLGYGFLESVYVEAVLFELRARRLGVAREVAVRVTYKGVVLARQRLDVIVERKVIVEVKTGPVILPVAQRQLRNYLRATGLEVGLVLNYGPRPQFMREYVPNQMTSVALDQP